MQKTDVLNKAMLDKGKLWLSIDERDLLTTKRVSSIPGTRYHVLKELYEMPLTYKNVESLTTWHFIFGKTLRDWERITRQDNEIRRMKLKKIPGFVGTLYPYQARGVEWIDECDGRALIADEMGLGKTIQALAWCQLHQEIRPVLIICPSMLKINWEREVQKWVNNATVQILDGRTPTELKQTDFVVINYDVLHWWANTLISYGFQALIADECFPAGTKISTPNGFKNIEEIKVGDLVNNAFGVGKIECVNERITKEMACLYLSNGEKISVTSNHPFFTEQGWIPAEKLTGHYLLQKTDFFYKLARNIKLKNNEDKKMCILRRRIFRSCRNSKVLWDILFSEMENESTGDSESCLHKRTGKKIIRIAKRKSQKKPRTGTTIIIKNEIKQPIKKSRNNRKDKSILEKVWSPTSKTIIKRWEWQTTADSTKSIMGSVRRRLESRIPNKNKNEKWFRVPKLLQSRFSISRITNMGGIRRMGAQTTGRKRKRQKERKLPFNVRVDRVEIFKSGSTPPFTGCSVYNLQVSGHPSYYANGFLVHNCHYTKNPSAKRTKAFKKVSKYITNIIALTGTPIENSPIEIFNIVNVLNPAIFPDYVRFTKQYCEGKNGRYGWDTSGSSDTQELYRILTATVMIRRKKSEVLKDLPPKQISVVPLQITNKQEYKQAEKQFMNFLGVHFDRELIENENIEKELRDYAKKHEVELSEEFTSADVQVVKDLKMEKAKNAHVLVQMSMLKQLAVKGKMDAVFEWVDDFLETGEKLVIFGINKVIIRELAKHYPTAARVDGSVTKSKRQKDIDRFQRDPNCKLFIGNIDAAGVGLTLTSASNVALVQYPWTPSKMSQAIDRVHRITQTKRVNVWNLIAAGTIEDKIIKVLSEKEKIITDILDGGIHDEASVASAILKMYKVR